MQGCLRQDARMFDVTRGRHYVAFRRGPRVSGEEEGPAERTLTIYLPVLVLIVVVLGGIVNIRHRVLRFRGGVSGTRSDFR